MSMATTSTVQNTSGVYNNTHLQKVIWGPGCVCEGLTTSLQLFSKAKKALVLTGNSLATKSDVIKKVEEALGGAYAATYTKIGQHAPVEGIKEAQALMEKKGVDIIIAVGGGSPIDAAKAISFYTHETNPITKGNDDDRSFTPIIAIPTTLSAAETTQNAGYSENNKKVGCSHPALVPKIIICDSELTLATPSRLWISTGMRAVDHAVELLYRPDCSPLLRMTQLGSLRELFHLLPATKRDPKNLGLRQRLQLVVVASLWPEARRGALGLSHGLGHALGATYSIPHGITSCITLGASIQATAQMPSTPPEQILALSEALDYIPAPYNPSPRPLGLPTSILATFTGIELEKQLGEARDRGVKVGQAVQHLVDELDLHTTLKASSVSPEDIAQIAGNVTGGQEGEKHDAVIKLLESVYDDKFHL